MLAFFIPEKPSEVSLKEPGKFIKRLCVQLIGVPWTVAHQPLLSMGFPRQEYESGLLYLLPGDLLRNRTWVSCIGRWVLYPLSHLGSPTKTFPEARWKECRPYIHLNPYQQPYPWTTAIKLTILGCNTKFLKGTSSLCPRFSGKARKLFFSTWHKTVCKIWFDTSTQRPSF